MLKHGGLLGLVTGGFVEGKNLTKKTAFRVHARNSEVPRIQFVRRN